MPIQIFERPTFKRAISAIHRAILPLPNDRVYEVDEIGAIEITAEPRVTREPRSTADRRARPRLALPRFAPPSWRLHRRRFAQILGRGLPFALLDHALRQELASLATWVAVPAGQALFSEGSPLDSVYVVAQGSFGLSRKVGGVASSLGVAQTGDLLGACSALGHYGALASAHSRAGGAVLKLSTACVVDAACSSPQLYAALASLAGARRHCHWLADSAFSELLGAEGRAGLSGSFQRVTLEAREPLLRAGEAGAFVAVVDRGQLALSTFSQGISGPERVQRSFGRGQAVGCVAALQGRTALGAVRAIEPTEISLVDATGLAALETMHPSLADLPALLHGRGELTAGSFFAVDAIRTPAELGWRDRIASVA